MTDIDEDQLIRDLENSRYKPFYQKTPSGDIPELNGSLPKEYGNYRDNSDFKLNNSSSYTHVVRSQIPLITIFFIIIVIGIIINLYLLFNLKVDRNNEIINSDDKNMAAINSIGMTVILSLIIGLAVFYAWEHNNKNMGVVFIVLLLASLLIIFLMGLLAGEYVNAGHIWTPIVQPPS